MHRRLIRSSRTLVVGVAMCLLQATTTGAQIIETVGSRALGMGGAFTGVADDSSATWWNPAGLAAGPFLDMALARATTGQDEALPAWRARTSWFAVGTPPVGLSYYRLRLTDVGPIEAPAGDATGVAPVRSVPVSQFGVSLVHTIVWGLHAGATIKYVRGTLLDVAEDVPGAVPGTGLPEARIEALLRRGDEIDGGRAQHRFDVDVGVMGVHGAIRAGGAFRNIRRPRFGDAVTLPRQIRAGAAWDGDLIGAMPLIVAVDADLRRYETVTGPRRVVAIGAERWLFERRLGLRTGARFNTVGDRGRAGTAGASFAARSGMYLEGHLVAGGSPGEAGWGLAARVTF